MLFSLTSVVKFANGAPMKRSRSIKRPKRKKDSWLKGVILLVLLALLATAVIIKKLRLGR